MKPLLLLVPLLALVACGQPNATVDVNITATHAELAATREVWSTRFRSARDTGLLPLIRANARIVDDHLDLSASLRADDCTQATIDALRAALVDLTTARHSLAIHRTVDPETLATTLRNTFDLDVHTPIERPGQLVVAAPLARITSALPTNAIVASSGDTTTLWLVEPVPALDGGAVASASADIGSNNAIEVKFTDAGSAQVNALTDAARGQYLVIVVDGKFALAPRVMERVSHSLRLDLPSTIDAVATRALARAIAASNLRDPPTLTSATATCAPQ